MTIRENEQFYIIIHNKKTKDHNIENDKKELIMENFESFFDYLFSKITKKEIIKG